MVDRVRYASVLGYALVCEVAFAAFEYCNVLKESVFLDCLVDIRLRLRIEVDNLCVAAAFIVEDSLVIPAVLIVTDKKTFRVG